MRPGNTKLDPRWRTIGALLFLLALTAGFYWRLTFSTEYTWLASPDMAYQVRPWLDFEAREFHAARFPAWDPYLWGGQSLIGQVQPGTANPLNWILFAWPLDNGHIPLAVLHWYWLLIHWLAAVFAYALCRDLGSGRIASVMGAASFALTGYVGHTDWPQMLMSAIWTPLVFLFLLRVFRGRRPWSSAALGGAVLGMALLAGHHNIPIYTALVVGLLWLWWLARSRAWGVAAVFGIVCLLVSALQTLPALEYARHAVRWAGPVDPLRWNEKVPYGVHAQYSLPWRGLAAMFLPGEADNLPVNPHTGAVILVLAGITLLRRTRDAKWLAVVIAAGLLLALGTHTPLYRALYAWVPLVEKARSPAMAIVLAQLALAALAALGLGRSRWLPYAAGALFLVEAVAAAPHLGRRDNLPPMHDDIAAFLRTQPGWFRVEVDENAIPYNFGDWYGIEHFGGYVASMPEQTFQLVGHDSVRRLFGVQFRVGRQPSVPGQVVVFESRSGLKVYRDPRIAPPLRSSCGEAHMVRRTPDEFVIDADMACDGLVVAGDVIAAGWRAMVDGRRMPIRPSDGLLRAVDVPAGRHRIEFRYRPASVYGGAALSALGLLVAALIVIFEPAIFRRASPGAK